MVSKPLLPIGATDGATVLSPLTGLMAVFL
jgi:hypothetical protein